MKVAAIILAAGKGSRMQSDIKKQYMLIDGKPVIWYSISAFQESSVDEIVLVTGKEDKEYCRELVKKNGFEKVAKIVEGGEERYDSVYKGLVACSDSTYVLIHDGARPLISNRVIEKCIHQLKKCEACVVGVPVKDTIKIVDEKGMVKNTPQRNRLWSIQTPQAFSYDLIIGAYNKMMKDKVIKVTDDAMVVELYSNQEVQVIEGDYTNIKITTIEDLIAAENFLKKSKKSVDTQND